MFGSILMVSKDKSDKVGSHKPEIWSGYGLVRNFADLQMLEMTFKLLITVNESS